MRVLSTVAEWYYLQEADLLGDSKKRRIAHPRQLCMWMLCDQGWGLSEVGDLFARDHTSVLYSKRAVEIRLTDPEYKKDVDAMLRTVEYGDTTNVVQFRKKGENS